MTRLNSQEVAFIEIITLWWSREIEERVTKDGRNAYLVTFMFNHLSGLPAERLKIMQDSVCRFYSTLVTRIVRKPNSIHQLFLRPRMLTVPDYPVFKYGKIGLREATVNDGLHMHSLLSVPLNSRLKVDIISHVAEKSRLYILHETRDKTEPGKPKPAKLYSESGMAKLVRRLRDEAGLPTTFTLDACRHGGMTELEEAELTDGQGRALSAHKSRAYEGYAKRTMDRALAATRKRHAHRIAASSNAQGTEFRNEGVSEFRNDGDSSKVTAK
jgi:hypothetical protein